MVKQHACTSTYIDHHGDTTCLAKISCLVSYKTKSVAIANQQYLVVDIKFKEHANFMSSVFLQCMLLVHTYHIYIGLIISVKFATANVPPE